MTLSKIKCVIFDVDGTIFDSETIWEQTCKQLCKKFNTTLSDEARLQMSGRNAKEIIAFIHKQCPDIDAAAFREQWEEMVFKYNEQHGMKFKKGFLNLMKYLQKTSLRVAIATGSRKSDVVSRFKKHNIDAEKMFEQIITTSQVKKGKPSPQVYKLVLKRLNLKAKNCIVIEDSPNGTKSAVKAGIPTILIPDVFKPDKFALKHAITILKDMDEAKTFLKSMGI